jgi:hypothetical protein
MASSLLSLSSLNRSSSFFSRAQEVGMDQYRQIFAEEITTETLTSLFNHGRQGVLHAGPTPVGLAKSILTDVSTGVIIRQDWQKAITTLQMLIQNTFSNGTFFKHPQFTDEEMISFIQEVMTENRDQGGILNQFQVEFNGLNNPVVSVEEVGEVFSDVIGNNSLHSNSNEMDVEIEHNEEASAAQSGIWTQFFYGVEGDDKTSWQSLNGIMAFHPQATLNGSRSLAVVVGILLDIFTVATGGLLYGAVSAVCYFHDRGVTQIQAEVGDEVEL